MQLYPPLVDNFMACTVKISSFTSIQVKKNIYRKIKLTYVRNNSLNLTSKFPGYNTVYFGGQVGIFLRNQLHSSSRFEV